MRFFFSIAFLLLIYSCNEENIKPSIEKNIFDEKIPDYESWNTEVIFSEMGDLKAVLFSDHIKKYEEDKVTFLEGVKIDFYDESGEKTTTLTSIKGRVDDITKDMRAIENVVVVSDSGVTLKTEELTWRNKIRKIMTDRFVTITSPEETIEGYGFESDQGLKNYKIFKITYSATVTDSTL